MTEKLNKDTVYSKAKPKEKDYTISDGGRFIGLLVKSSGVKRWLFAYRFNGKQNRLGFGVYPDTTLGTARRKAEDARAQVANGIDPGETKKQAKQSTQADAENANRKAAGLPILNSFEHAARDWLASIEHLTTATTHIKKTSRIERLALPVLGNMPIKEIKSSNVLAALKPLIDKSQLETAHRLHSEISAAFAYAIVHNFTDYDPAQPVTKQIPAQKVKHRAAIIDPKQVAQLLRDIGNYQGTFVVQLAFRLSPLLFQRPGEIRQMLWSDVDLVAREWRPYVSKTDFHHIVPLPTQAVAILEAIQPLTGSGQYVFPSSRGDGCQTALKTFH